MPGLFSALTSDDYVDATTLNARFQSLEDALLGVLDGTLVGSLVKAEAVQIVPTGTATASVVVGQDRSGSGYSRVDLVGDTTYSTYGLRIERGNGGANTNSSISHRGTGILIVEAADAGSIQLKTGGTLRATVQDDGIVDVVGVLRAGGLRSDADPGAGLAGVATLTHTTDTPTASLTWTGVGAPNGYWKIYIGTQAYVIPIWVT